MKKILVAIDAVTYNENSIDQAIHMAQRSGGMVLGVFLHDLSYINYTLPGAFVLSPVEYTAIVKKQKDDHEKLELNLKLFNDKCNKENVKHKAHIHEGVDIIHFLLQETVFADLLILDEHMSFTYVGAQQLSNFVIDVLEDAHCPVLVVPDKAHVVDNVYLCYDGTPSSVQAIKMYAYLFPEWSSKPTTLVSFNESSSNHLIKSENIKDLLHQHFTHLHIDVEHHLRVGDAIYSYFKLHEEGAFLVMGAYGRSAFSRLFKKSIANTIIREVRVPIFITHE